ncbi:hypothetical protein GGR03_003764 [Aurantimonas endophytica]|uniref:Uncharacterized protein n=1 Tax=Aurantimonas endophytica TaxID=1522175 RepID=A0A7W6MR58_9HYPH|nr:hypothetical protein [Aurantimonas endophytica]
MAASHLPPVPVTNQRGRIAFLRQAEERVIVQMITHLKQTGSERSKIFFVGRGTIEEVFEPLWP